jgi:hypothetical protein
LSGAVGRGNQLSAAGGRGNQWQGGRSRSRTGRSGGRTGQKRPSATEREEVREEQIRVRAQIFRNWTIRVHARERLELREQIVLGDAGDGVQVEPAGEEISRYTGWQLLYFNIVELCVVIVKRRGGNVGEARKPQKQSQESHFENPDTYLHFVFVKVEIRGREHTNFEKIPESEIAKLCIANEFGQKNSFRLIATSINPMSHSRGHWMTFQSSNWRNM